MTKECPEVDPRALLGTLYGEDLYCSFTKVNAAIGHATSTVTLDGEDIECQVACQRQENDISISTQGFPGESFSRTPDFWLVVYKLFWSCRNEFTRYGFKRPGLDRKYPGLCTFYDEYFYGQNDINNKVESFNTSKEFLGWQSQELRFSDLQSKLGMSKVDQEEFVKVMMLYCKDNLARVMVFVQKPFLTIYKRDQVMSYLQLVANMGGLLGLCMGFSMVSVDEIFYHMVLNPVLHFRARRTKRKEDSTNKVMKFGDWSQ